MNFRRNLVGSYPRTTYNKIQHVDQNVRRIHELRNLNLQAGSVLVVCLVKNGEFYVQAFIEHYFRIGATHIVLMDNGSCDRTLYIAKKYDRVTVVECHLPFSEYKLAMRIFLAEVSGKGNWCLSVDIDEFYEFPFCDSIRLSTLVQYLEKSGFTACVAHQLDLFGKETITKTGGTDKSLADIRYFDLSDIYYWREISKHSKSCPDQRLVHFFSRNIVSNPDIPVMARGVRWHLFGITPVLTKIPLFKLVPPVTPFINSSHRLEGAVLADISCVLLHMLLNQHLSAKATWCEKEGSYYNNSAHYRQIANTLALRPVHLPVCRKLYRSVSDLVALNFLHVSTDFSRFAITHRYTTNGHPVSNLRTLPLHVPSTQPRGIFEKYLHGEIEITAETSHICECKLDEKGCRRFAEYSSESEVEIVIGIARLKWKSSKDRTKCIELQRSKNKNRVPGESRWTEIVSMVSAIKRNKQLPFPALVHPALHGYDGLQVIDGARRIIANVEASNASFPVIIIKPANSSFPLKKSVESVTLTC